MATITYQVLQKPMEERIIDAACIYWEVDRTYFTQKRSDTNATYRKGIVYYLIKQNTTYTYGFMAERFGFLSHQPVLRLVENLECTKDVQKQHLNDINQIQALAEKLDAAFIGIEAKLFTHEEGQQLSLVPTQFEERIRRHRKESGMSCGQQLLAI